MIGYKPIMCSIPPEEILNGSHNASDNTILFNSSYGTGKYYIWRL